MSAWMCGHRENRSRTTELSEVHACSKVPMLYFRHGNALFSYVRTHFDIHSSVLLKLGVARHWATSNRGQRSSIAHKKGRKLLTGNRVAALMGRRESSDHNFHVFTPQINLSFTPCPLSTYNVLRGSFLGVFRSNL